MADVLRFHVLQALDAFAWHASLGEAGVAEAERLAQAADEEHGARVHRFRLSDRRFQSSPSLT